MGWGGAEFPSPMGLPVQVRPVSLPAEVTISIKTVTAAQVPRASQLCHPGGVMPTLPPHAPWYGPAWLGVPDLAESAPRDPNCLLMSVNIALLFKTKWGAFLSPLSREQAVWGPGGWWESETTLVSLHLLRMLGMWEHHRSCFSLALPQDAGTVPGGAAVRLLWGLAQGSSRRLGEEEKEEGIWLLASSLEGLQGLTGPSPGSQLPLGLFNSSDPGNCRLLSGFRPQVGRKVLSAEVTPACCLHSVSRPSLNASAY